jgi:hypothetical protein
MTRLSTAFRMAALIVALLAGFALQGRAQSTDGYVDIIYDEWTGDVRAFATTYPDYDASYYYEPIVYVSLAGHRESYPYNVWFGENWAVGITHGAYPGGYSLTSVSGPWQPDVVTYIAEGQHAVDIYYYDEGQYAWWDAFGYISLEPECVECCYWDDELEMLVCTVCVEEEASHKVWIPPLMPAWVYVGTAGLGNTEKEEQITGPPTLQVWNGVTPVSQNQAVYIFAGSSSSVPEMPELSANLTSASLIGSVTWKMRIDYNGHGRGDSDWFPSSSGTTLPATSTWNINFGSLTRGGTATLYYRYNSQAEKYFTFTIGGTNPSENDAKGKLGSDPWFLTRIARQESGIHQFSGSSPLFGSPNGWGIMQVDPPPGPEQIWNWHANVQEGKDRLEEKKTDPLHGLNHDWDHRLQEWNQWNQEHTDKHVDPPPDKAEGTQCTFKWNDGNYGSESVKSFKDACWIKRYNGAAADYIFWDTRDRNNETWGYNNDGGYVTAVCSKNP